MHILPFIFTLHNARLYANIWTFNWLVQNHQNHIIHISQLLHVYIVRSYLTKEMLHKTVYISFLYMCIFYQHFLTFSLGMSRDGLKRNYELSYLSFSYVIIFKVVRKQKIVAFLRYSYFIEHHCHAMSKASSGSKETGKASQGFQHPCISNQRGTD